MSYIQCLKRNRLRMVSDMSEASTTCSSTSTTSTSPSPTIGYVIFSKTHGTCFISNLREIDWEWSQKCQRPPSHAHRRRQHQHGKVLQIHMSCQHTWHMFNIHFLRTIDRNNKILIYNFIIKFSFRITSIYSQFCDRFCQHTQSNKNYLSAN